MNKKFKGKNIVITGDASEIGRLMAFPLRLLLVPVFDLVANIMELKQQ